ncbi:ADP-ribosylglycohydrolase family protein [Frankia sp. CNm7]|uniref:ADP-ribosylglycohydrolase family protein n=1 Tax=Frankia nepalensis TaxID=1836974 RepID=A0A937RR93_9ACTN|nr:ADP-ribosylglycohydrolase family protein [Frankia nepalensis]MBL7497250.1 ADP-ribosylglycohydrolase family protein [Frankia nepalensis]MBL7512952.1 ADP-ribosylglycohydrolase family protein [Frankia nepalensis]MBL7519195.1 ADP-ribosylglycohydrolase family protein [Frankia nepalensis]MBL7633490.1 ADP-ribosylglycohydrolase family protein [Frankia nepalensis]
MKLDVAQIDRACGVLLGAAVGDALGAPYEFDLVRLGPEGPRMVGGGLTRGAPGEWTDDTAMTWCVADVAATGADLRTGAALDAIATGLREWYESHPLGIGQQTWRVISAAGTEPTAAVMTAIARDLYIRTGRAAGNGALTRTAPVALAHLDDPAALVEAAMTVSALTHYDPRAREACALWCLAIRHAVLEAEFDAHAGLSYLDVDAWAYWADALAAAERSDPGRFRPNGWAVAALQAAWSAIVHTPVPKDGFGCRHLADSLRTAISIGHDTDTVAAIAGALLGARWGESAVPAEWRRTVHGYPGRSGQDLVHLAYLTVNNGPGTNGWPLADHIDYIPLQYGDPPLVPHPHDEGVYLAGAPTLDTLPNEIDAVVSLCLTGRAQVPARVEHVAFRLLDEPDPAMNPNLDFILTDAARLVAQLRDEGKTVLLHCVAAHSRTPSVAVAYAMLRGVPHDEALATVLEALPTAHSNSGFQAALKRLARLLT